MTVALERAAALPEAVIAMRQALSDLESMVDFADVHGVWKNADVAEVAFRRAKARDLEANAAEVRLHAERRLGQMFKDGVQTSEFSAREVREFQHLASMPKELFEEIVTYQLVHKRSSTPFSVIQTSRHHRYTYTKYDWLHKAWDGTWVFEYKDPKTRRVRSGTCDGTMDDASAMRAQLSGRIKQKSTDLLPIRGRAHSSYGLALVLDGVRQARDNLGRQWSDLSPEQKNELDGAYGRLDDLAAALIRATNMD